MIRGLQRRFWIGFLLLAFAALPDAADLRAGICSAIESGRRNIENLKDAVQLATERIDRAELRVQDLESQAPTGPSAEVQQATEAVRKVEQRLADARLEESEIRRGSSELSTKVSAVDTEKAGKVRELVSKTQEHNDRMMAAAAARGALDAEPGYARVRAEIKTLEQSVAARVGAKAADALKENPAAIMGAGFSGDPGSELDRLVGEHRVLDKQANALFRSGNQQEINDKLAAKAREIKALRGAVRQSLQEAKKKREWDLLVAEEEAKDKLTAEQRDALKDIGTLGIELERIKAARNRLQTEANRLRRREADLRGRSDANRELQVKLEGELTAAREALQRARANKTPIENDLEAARSELRAAKDELSNLTTALDRSADRQRGRESELARFRTSIQPRFDQGKSLSRAGAQARDNGDQQRCLEQVTAARDEFLAALSLVQDNRDCLPGADSLVTEITGYLNRVERGDCGGKSITPAPRDGTVEVPPLTGMTREEAIAAVKYVGLQANAYPRFQPTSPDQAGKVKEQSPPAGSRQPVGTMINIMLYDGLKEVPAVDGGNLTYEEAITTLAGLGLFGDPQIRTPDIAKAAMVYSQSVPAGTMVLPGRHIQLLFHCDPDAPAGWPARCPGAAPPAGSSGGSTAPSAGGAAGSGFTASGGVKTVSSTAGPAGGATPGGAPAGGGPSPAPTLAGETGDAWARNAQSAKDSCDLGRALRNADILAAENPRHPWLDQNYNSLLADIAKQNAAETAMRQARVVLSRPNVTKADILQAAALARQAQGNSTRCISQQISSLTSPIRTAEAAVKQADSARNRAAAAGLLGSLTGILNTAIAASNGGSSTGRGGSGGGATGGGGGVDISDIMAEGGLIPPRGRGGTGTVGGSPSGAGGSRSGGTGSTGGGQSGGLPCEYCVISQFGVARERVHYVFSLRRPLPNPSCPGGRAAGVGYYIFSASPTDDDGRPLSYFPDEDVRSTLRALGTLGAVSKVCGPCGSHAQAAAVVRQRCPRPMSGSSFRR